MTRSDLALLASAQSTDLSLPDGKPGHELRVRRAKRLEHSEVRDLGIAEHSSAVALSAGIAPRHGVSAAGETAGLAPLGALVMHVVGLGADEEVLRVHARGDVAFVTNAEAIRDGANVELVANAMCSTCSSVDEHHPVSEVCSAAIPDPATMFIDLNAAHESHSQLFESCHSRLSTIQAFPRQTTWVH